MENSGGEGNECVDLMLPFLLGTDRKKQKKAGPINVKEMAGEVELDVKKEDDENEPRGITG